MSAIPTRSRELVNARQALRCGRCPAPGTDLHHRRRRRVNDDHQHCPCNLIRLCRTCHDWVHGHPWLATEAGFIVKTNIDIPGICEIQLYTGTVHLACDGTTTTEGNHHAHEGPARSTDRNDA